MANFCTKCGKPIDECTCNKTIIDQSFFASLKNRMGIVEPENNNTPLFEKDMQIIPDNVKADNGEVPVKQFTVATMRNRLFGITIGKAIGRLQVTNKRVIFRASGRCLRGRTTLQQEFSIDEIAGVEVRREFAFNFWDIIIGLIIALIGNSLGYFILSFISKTGFRGVLSFILGFAALIPFFMVNKRFGLKLFCCGLSGGLFLSSTPVRLLGRGVRGDSEIFFVFCVISAIIALVCLTIFVIKPNLVLIIKTKSSGEAIDIQRRKIGIFGFTPSSEEHTNYSEVIPAENAEQSIREIFAIVSDIQKLGDFGIEKWKE